MHGMVVAANTRLAAHHRVNSNCPGRSGERAHSSPFPSLFSVLLSFFLRLPDRPGRKASSSTSAKATAPAHTEIRERDSPCNVNKFLERHRRQTFCKVSGHGGTHDITARRARGALMAVEAAVGPVKEAYNGLEVQSRNCLVSLPCLADSRQQQLVPSV